MSAQGAPTQVNGKGGPRACSAQMPPGFCHLLMSHRLLPLLGSPPISAHSFPCGLALCQGFASVRKCLWEAQERTRMRDKGKGKAREGYVVWESPLGAAETPCSWGLQRHCMEHSSELVFGGREAGCLPLHCFPSLGVSPGGTGLPALLVGSGKWLVRAPMARERAKAENPGSCNCLQVTSKVAQGDTGETLTSATGLYACNFTSCSQ